MKQIRKGIVWTKGSLRWVAAGMLIAAAGFPLAEAHARAQPYELHTQGWLRLTWGDDEDFTRFAVERLILGADIWVHPKLVAVARVNLFQEPRPVAVLSDDGSIAGWIPGRATRWRTRAEDAYLDLRLLPILSFQAGVIPVPFGLLDLWEYPTPADAPEERISLGLVPGERRLEPILERRDIGVAVTGKFPGGYGGYGLAAVQGAGPRGDDVNEAWDGVASLKVHPFAAFDPVRGLFLRASWYEGKRDEAEERRRRGAVTLAFENRRVTLAAQAGRTEDGEAEGRWFTGIAAVRIVRRLEAVARWDRWDPETGSPEDFWSAGLTWHFLSLEGTKLMLQGAWERRDFETAPEPLDRAVLQVRWEM